MVHRSTKNDEDIQKLNKMSQSGKITPSERTRRREELLTNKILEQFYKKGEQIQDGRKS